MSVWLNNKHFLFNLRTLCFLNWVYVSNESGYIKKLSSLWLYNILYNCLIVAYRKDKPFFSSLLYYTLIQNERIFMVILDKFLKTEDISHLGKYDTSSIFYHLVQYYSNRFKGWGKELTYSQLQFLSAGRKKHDLPNLFRNNHACPLTIEETIINELASKLNDYISNMLSKDSYPHSEIIDLFKDMIPYDIPDNFRYMRGHHDTYHEYNGDYTGTYAHDVMGYTNDEIDTIFDGDPNAYWNID